MTLNPMIDKCMSDSHVKSESRNYEMVVKTGKVDYVEQKQPAPSWVLTWTSIADTGHENKEAQVGAGSVHCLDRQS